MFVAHPLNPPSASYTIAEYRAGIEALLRETEQICSELDAISRLGYSRVRLHAIFENVAHDEPMSAQTISSIANSDLAVVDLTDTSPNVMYELGYLDASAAPVILIVSSATSTRVPVDIADRYVAHYGTTIDIPAAASATMVGCVEKSLRKTHVLPTNRALAWFPPDVQGIHLVGALSPDNLYSADPSYANFVYLEQYSDKDTVLELMVLLSRMYTARVHKYTSGDFPRRQLLRDNLVVVGGPGVQGVNDGNPICREIAARINSRVRYANDGESVTLKGTSHDVTLRPNYDQAGNLLKDFGYFARFPNPFAPDSTVVLVNGLHTAGGLGAALAFSDRPQAATNFRVVRARLDADRDHGFEAIFEVETMSGDVLVPRLNSEWVFPLEEQRK